MVKVERDKKIRRNSNSQPVLVLLKAVKRLFFSFSVALTLI